MRNAGFKTVVIGLAVLISISLPLSAAGSSIPAWQDLPDKEAVFVDLTSFLEAMQQGRYEEALTYTTGSIRERLEEELQRAAESDDYSELELDDFTILDIMLDTNSEEEMLARVVLVIQGEEYPVQMFLLQEDDRWLVSDYVPVDDDDSTLMEPDEYEVSEEDLDAVRQVVDGIVSALGSGNPDAALDLTAGRAREELLILLEDEEERTVVSSQMSMVQEVIFTHAEYITSDTIMATMSFRMSGGAENEAEAEFQIIDGSWKMTDSH